jgi:6-phosphogluconolactonase (cycloisomerase 2 family)
MSKYWLLVGSFNPLISTLQFTASPPSLSFVSQFKAGTSPTWLAYSPKFPTTVYATDETETGSINSLALDLKTGNLSALANLSTKGGAPTHLNFLNNGTALGAANFVNGSAFIVNLDATATGQFTPNNALVPFEGFGPLPNQLTPHAHQVGNPILIRVPTTHRADRLGFCCLS